MAKRFAEQHAVFPYQRSNLLPKKFDHLSQPRQVNNDDLCDTFSHNQPDWVAYMDESELSCVPGLNQDGSYITFRTGKHTKIDTIQACTIITTDPKDQKACIKKLNRGMLPGLDGYNGEVTIHLNDHKSISFRQDGLFTDASEYDPMIVVNAIASANYTQRVPDMTSIKLINTVKENPIITALSIGVISFAVITAFANIVFSKVKQHITKRNRPKPNLSPIPILMDKEQTMTSASPKVTPAQPHSPQLGSKQDLYDRQVFFPNPSRHSKNGKPVDD